MASKKKTTKKAASKKVSKKAAKKSGGQSKMDRAVLIMEESWKGYCDDKIQRKDIIKRFIDEAGLTKAGAATYWNTLKNRFLVDET